MKKHLVGFILLFLICTLIPLGAIADLSIVWVHYPCAVTDPCSIDPGDTMTFVVEVREDGSPVSGGQSVTFSITSGDGNAWFGYSGTATTRSTTTSSNGRSSATVRLGSRASGSYTVTASAGSASISVTVTSSTPPPPPPSPLVQVVSHPGSGSPGDTLTFTVNVRRGGSPASGETVTFRISPANGTVSLSPTSTTTDSSGNASTTLTLGSRASGTYTVGASVGGHSLAVYAIVEPSTSQPEPGLSINVVSRPGSGAPGDALPFAVEVWEDGSLASGKTVTFGISPANGTVSLNPPSATTDSNGRASTTARLGSRASGSYTVTASVGDESVSVTATVETPPPPPNLSIVWVHYPCAVTDPCSIDPGDTMTFVVEVREDGSPVSGGQPVEFSITSGDGNAWFGYSGTATTRSTTTSSNGRSSATARLGSRASGSYTVTASAGSASTNVTVTVGGPPPPPVPLVQVVSHPGSGSPGDTLTFTVNVRKGGSPASGETVTFRISPANGTVSLSPTSTTTDSSGNASTTLTLGSRASGTYTVGASVGGHSLAVYAIVEPSTSQPEPGLSINVVSRPGSGAPSDELPFTVEVWEDGSLASGKTVTFGISPANGTVSLSPPSATTDSSGRASTTLTLGNSASGSYTVTASVGDESVSVTATAEIPPDLSIVVIHSPGSADPGNTLTFLIEVQEDGSPVSGGQPVEFSITSGDGNAWFGYWGTATTRSTTTSSNGRASVTIRLGSRATGSYTITASAGNASVSVTATSNTPPPLPVLSIYVETHPGSGSPGDELTFTVRVRKDGSPASGETVTFGISPNNGTVSLSSTSTTTDSDGHASTTLMLGSRASGSYRVRASVGRHSLAVYASVTPSTSQPEPGLSINVVSRPGSGAPGDELPFAVEVWEDGSLASGKTVTFGISPANGTVSLNPPSATTDNNGRASTTVRLGNDASGSYTVTASVGDESVSVTATAEIPPNLSIVWVHYPCAVTDPCSIDPGDTMTFIVEVREDGSPVSGGQPVEFSITSGDGNAWFGYSGTATTRSTTTSSNGRSSATARLGSRASGSYTVTASAGNASVNVTVTVNTPPPPPPVPLVQVVSHPGSGSPGDTLTFTVNVRKGGSPVSGETVRFGISPANGTVSLSPTSTTTDSNGDASTTLTLGSRASGSYRVSARVDDQYLAVYASVETSTPPPPLRTLVLSMDQLAPQPGDTVTFTAEVTQGGSGVSGQTVTFDVNPDNGTASLNPTSVTTDSNGQAQTMLALGGSASGSYTVTASVGAKSVSKIIEVMEVEVSEPQQQQPPPPIPTALAIALDDNQSGRPGETLLNPFVVEVRDQNGNPQEGVTVNFAVSAGGGALSDTNVGTDANGLAQSTLTLGGAPGLNTVEVSIEGIAETATFNAAASLLLPTSTAFSIISGDNQSGLTGEVLANPFVVEVRDQYDAPLEGVTIVFAVSAGGGSLSDTSVNTDANGLAQSTLTLGGAPGLNTVEVSVEGIAETLTFNAIAELLEFDLSLPSGLSLIHVPLKVRTVDGEAQTIESVSDLYDALGGTDTVNSLITYNSETQNWHSYFGDADRGLVADRMLTDDTGILVSMKAPVAVRLGGDALGVNGVSTMTLQPGLNLVGLPLRDSRINRVSDLLRLDGIWGNVRIVTVTVNGNLRSVGWAGDPGDIEVTGGQSFILSVQEAATVTISGDAWANTSAGTMAAPSLMTGGIQMIGITPVLALSGSIVHGVRSINSAGLRVTVKNLSTGSAVAAMIDETGDTPSQVDYRLTVVDIAGERAAAIGDILEIAAISPDASIDVEPLRYTVTAEDVRRSRIELPPLCLQEIPAETELLRNYPNPFNPETWIPYRLAEDAFVTLTIYNSSGQVVRTLDVGHQRAAIYESRSKAAYWNGRNDLGESVASGVYFYTLMAGDYSATRKMLILK